MSAKQNVYLEQIAPLMDQIVDICNQNNIQMFSAFYLEDIEGIGSIMNSSYVPATPSHPSVENALKAFQQLEVAELEFTSFL